MSLVITSNRSVIDGNEGLNSGINLPYQYHNSLTQPLKIEPDSEVAVQSVKLVRSGDISITRGNNCFYGYFGDTTNAIFPDTEENQEAGVVGGFAEEFTTSLNVRSFIGDVGTFTNHRDVNVDTLAEVLQRAVSDSMSGYPNFLKSQINSLGMVVTPERLTSTDDKGKFTGFTYTLNQSTSASHTDTKTNLAFTDLLNSEQYSGSWNTSNHRVTKTEEDKRCEMIGTGMPLSLTNGSFRTNFKNAGGGWEIGLSRYMDTTKRTHLLQNPSYYSSDENLDIGAGVGFSVEAFYDWVVKSVQEADGSYRLRVYHSVYDDDDTDTLYLKEFQYWTDGPSSGDLSGPITIFENSGSYSASSITDVHFEVQNEKMILSVHSDDFSSASHVLSNGGNDTGVNTLKPTNTCNRYMYPRVRVLDHNKYVSVILYNGVDIDGFVYGDRRQGLRYDGSQKFQRVNNMDFWARLFHSQNGVNQFGKDLDFRYMFNVDDTTSGPSSNGNYTQIGLNNGATGGLSGSLTFILKEDNGALGEGPGNVTGFRMTKGANAGELMGFGNDALLDNPHEVSGSGNIQTYNSHTTPQMVSRSSVFVKVPNLTHESFNGKTSQPSKILYHLPRFDNSGNEFGGLFFEPTERVYVKLNNPQTLNLNDFDISLVNADETLADNITGITIVVLHIRKSR